MAKSKKYKIEEDAFPQNLVEEPETPYFTSFQNNFLAWQLIQSNSFQQKEPVSTLDFLYTNNEGVPKSSAVKVANAMDVPLKDMAWLLNLSYKTFARKKPQDRLDALTSSLTIEIANVIEEGVDTFKDIGKFRNWLQKSNKALQGHTPFSLLNTPTGIRMVKDVLGRINEGIYT